MDKTKLSQLDTETAEAIIRIINRDKDFLETQTKKISRKFPDKAINLWDSEDKDKIAVLNFAIGEDFSNSDFDAGLDFYIEDNIFKCDILIRTYYFYSENIRVAKTFELFNEPDGIELAEVSAYFDKYIDLTIKQMNRYIEKLKGVKGELDLGNYEVDD